MALTWKQKFNKKHKQPLDASNSLSKIARLSGISRSSIQKIYNKGIGAFKTAGPSRPNMTKEQWAYARVYSAVGGGKAAKVDAKELGKKKIKKN